MNATQKKILQANGRNVRLRGVVYRIRATNLVGTLLAQAEPFKGETVDLMKTTFPRNPMTVEIRKLINLNLFV